MKVNNYRDNKVDDEAGRSSPDLRLSARGEGQKEEENVLETFAFEDIPTKMIMVDQKAAEDAHMIVYHSGNLLINNHHLYYYRGLICPTQTDH